MDVLRKFDDYVKAVSAAKQVHKLTHLSAISSVARAKLCFGRGPRMHALLSLGGIPVAEWSQFERHKNLEAILKQLNPVALRRISSDKILFSKHCMVHNIPHSQTVYHDLADPALSAIDQRDQFCSLIDLAPEELFFKLMDGEHGYGAFRAERKGTVWSYCGTNGTTGELYDFCRARQGSSRGWLVQPILKTHTSLLEISSSRALSTVRVVTCMTPEGPAIMFALLKLARGLSETDNFDMGRTGNMAAEIDIESGRLGPAKGSLSKTFPCISSFDIDPSSGHQITGRVVPYWDETKKLTLQAQSTLPDLKSLGWDVAITDEGPCVVETNTNYGSELLEMVYGRGLKPDFIKWGKMLS